MRTATVNVPLDGILSMLLSFNLNNENKLWLSKKLAESARADKSDEEWSEEEEREAFLYTSIINAAKFLEKYI